METPFNKRVKTLADLAADRLPDCATRRRRIEPVQVRAAIEAKRGQGIRDLSLRRTELSAVKAGRRGFD